MAYVDTYNLRYNSATLKPKTEVAVVTAATNVLNEDAGTANHANRILWAQWALKNSKQATEQMLWGVVGNATIVADGDSASDADVQFVVNSYIDSFADGSHA